MMDMPEEVEKVEDEYRHRTKEKGLMVPVKVLKPLFDFIDELVGEINHQEQLELEARR